MGSLHNSGGGGFATGVSASWPDDWSSFGAGGKGLAVRSHGAQQEYAGAANAPRSLISQGARPPASWQAFLPTPPHRAPRSAFRDVKLMLRTRRPAEARLQLAGDVFSCADLAELRGDCSGNQIVFISVTHGLDVCFQTPSAEAVPYSCPPEGGPDRLASVTRTSIRGGRRR